jgi:hypothetical protein
MPDLWEPLIVLTRSAERGPVAPVSAVRCPGHRPVDRPQAQATARRNLAPAVHITAVMEAVIVAAVVFGDDARQQQTLQSLQRCRADGFPPCGQHRARGHRVRAPPR